MIFRRKPTVSEDSYMRWLRAERPPFDWFMRQSEAVQEALAQRGDEHISDICVAVGYAVADPQAADAGMDGGPEGDEALARRLALGMIDRIADSAAKASQRPPQSPVDHRPPTFSGRVNRRSVMDAVAQGVKAPATLLGRPPDEVAP